MVLKQKNSRVYIINLLADFLLTKIPHNEESIFSVVDCKNFIIIKGKTSHREILDISSIVKEFNEKYEPSTPISHTIDLIEYDNKLVKVKSIETILHKSDNCSYHKNQINKFISENISVDYCGFPFEYRDDNSIAVSEFPHGFSLSQGRSLYLYCKHIFYSIPTNYTSSSLVFNISLDKDDEGDNIISIFNLERDSEDEKLKSAVLDVFDFDLSSLCSEMKKVDWSIELANPLEEYSFIKKKNKDFIIF